MDFLGSVYIVVGWGFGTRCGGKVAGRVKKAFPLWGKVARNAPDEGDMSGSFPLISHLR